MHKAGVDDDVVAGFCPNNMRASPSLMSHTLPPAQRVRVPLSLFRKFPKLSPDVMMMMTMMIS